MPRRERDEDETVGLTDMVLDAEPDTPPRQEKAKDAARDPARDGSDPDENLPLAGQ
jgi:hypothetical protein